MRRYPVWLAVCGSVVLAGVPASLTAQGYSVNEHSSCAMGRAGTAVASPCADGSSIFFNPAGIANAAKGVWTISTGVTAIAPSGGFTNDATGLRTDLEDIVIPVPALYVQGGLTDKLSAGIGAFAPYGLTTKWPSNSEVRFRGYKSTIRAIYVQPTLAYKLTNQLKVGAGFDVNFLHLGLEQRVDLASQQAAPGITFGMLGFPVGTDIADVELTGNGTGVGYHLGAMWEPSSRVSFGLRYMSRQLVKINSAEAAIDRVYTGIILPRNNPLGAPQGTPLDSILSPQFSGSGPLQDQGGRTWLRMPEQLTAGVMVRPIEKLKLLLDVTYTNWVVFDTITIHTDLLPTTYLAENANGSTAWRYGAEYEVSPGTVIRGGYLFHDAALPAGSVTPNLPEGKRAEFTLGFGTRLGSKLHADVAYQYIDQQDRRGRTVDFGQPDNGLFEFKAHLFGATLSYTF
ncbi:MAG: outer membrane protein transport protein [Gemmatimonadales bacterium]